MLKNSYNFVGEHLIKFILSFFLAIFFVKFLLPFSLFSLNERVKARFISSKTSQSWEKSEALLLKFLLFSRCVCAFKNLGVLISKRNYKKRLENYHFSHISESGIWVDELNRFTMFYLCNRYEYPSMHNAFLFLFTLFYILHLLNVHFIFTLLTKTLFSNNFSCGTYLW